MTTKHRLESAGAVMREIGIRAETRRVNGKPVRVVVHPPWWSRENRQDAVQELLDRCVPKGERRRFKVERISAAARSSDKKEDVSIIRVRPVVGFVVRDVKIGKRKTQRVPIIYGLPLAARARKETGTPSKLVVIDYTVPQSDEKTMTEKRMILLPDGKYTDNEGWQRLERPGKTPHFKKEVEGKSYIIDWFKASAARVNGSLNDDSNAPVQSAPPRPSSFIHTNAPRRTVSDSRGTTKAPAKPKPDVTVGGKLSQEFKRLTEEKPKDTAAHRAARGEPAAGVKATAKKVAKKPAKAPVVRKGRK